MSHYFQFLPMRIAEIADGSMCGYFVWMSTFLSPFRILCLMSSTCVAVSTDLPLASPALDVPCLARSIWFSELVPQYKLPSRFTEGLPFLWHAHLRCGSGSGPLNTSSISFPRLTHLTFPSEKRRTKWCPLGPTLVPSKCQFPADDKPRRFQKRELLTLPRQDT